MARALKPIPKTDTLDRFLEMFPPGYFKNAKSISKPLALFSQSLATGRVISVEVRPRGWLLKTARNKRINLSKWKVQRGLSEEEIPAE